MKHPLAASTAFACFVSLGWAAAGCGGGGTVTTTGVGGHTGSGSATSGNGATGGASSGSAGPSTTASVGGGSTTSSGGATTTASSGATTTAASSGATTGSSSSGGTGVADPNVDGPYAFTELDDTIASVSGGDSNIPVHCAYPTSGPTAGPYPVVVVGHGLSLPAAQYYGYVKRLASFGYVALTVDFPSSPFSVDNPKEAKDMLAGLDWAKNKAVVKADASTAGMTGHSLGGKVALLAATLDPRVKAAIVLDPVDGGGPNGCNPPGCVSVAPLMPGLHIPTGFLGETTDAMGGFMPCAPAASNFTTFYAKTNAPSLEVTVAGADHMSFLDDVSTCGFICGFCNPATAPNAQVNGLARAFVAAFYERHLRGDAGYDTYLTGAAAQMRYVTTAEATITSK